MGDYNSIRTHHEFMSFNIYNFLDNLLAAVRPSETLESESLNCDQVNTDIKPGGYSEDIFIFLSAREKEEYCCSVCYSVVKDAHQCRNDHKFCYSCIYVWSTCNRAGADCCPACRCEGVYARNDQINEKIGRKRVKCISEGCNWRGFLREYNDHEHRIYDFRELNTTIELPFIKEKDSPILVNSVTTNKIDSNELVKSEEAIDPESDLNKSINQNVSTNNGNEQINLPDSPIPERVSRPSLAPRRLVRETENNSHNARPPILRPNLNNYSRFTILSTRCSTYRNSNNNTRLSRLSRNSVNGNLNNHDSNSITTENASRPTANNEFTQTHILDNVDSSHQQTTSNNREHSRDATDLSSNRGANGGMTRRNIQLPAINQNNANHVTSERAQLEYRRLAPTYASRRNNFMISPSEGREQLAMMLILLTSDLEDRVSLSEQARDQSTSHGPIGGGENTLSSTSPLPSSSTLTNRATGVRLGRSRLQEFRNLNRRLSEVANSLDRLIASTSREGEMNNTDFIGRSDSVNSNESDVDEDFNNSIFYR